MKKVFSILLILMMVLSSTSTVAASAEKEPSERMMALISANDDFKLIAEHSHYMYTHLVEDLEEDKVPELIRMIGFYLKEDYATGIPEETYIKVLSDIIISYDLDNAADISAQAQQDDLKGFLSYTMDSKDALVDIADLIDGPTELAESIKTAIDGLSVLADHLDDNISALYDLDTLVKDYTQYDLFLETIEKSSDGSLKSAASKMRTSLKNAIKLRLEKQEKVLTSTGINYGCFFMSDIAVDLLKESPDYLNDSCFHELVDRGGKVCEVLDEGGAALDLGFIIGKTIGNLVVGGENLITRVNELRALDEISHCLSSEATMLRSNTMAALDEEKVDDVIFLNQMLINCRIRGEYSVYSILASDAGLLSWAGVKTKEKALDAYNRQTTVLSNIEKRLTEISYKDSKVRKKSEGSDNQDEIIEQYKTFIQSQNTGNDYQNYIIYDIDKDGYPELLILTTIPEERRSVYEIYSYKSGSFEFKTQCKNCLPHGPAAYASYPNGNGMIAHYSFRGAEGVILLSLNGYEMQEEQLYLERIEEHPTQFYLDEYDPIYADSYNHNNYLNHQFYVGEAASPYCDGSYLLGQSAMDDFTALYEAFDTSKEVEVDTSEDDMNEPESTEDEIDMYNYCGANIWEVGEMLGDSTPGDGDGIILGGHGFTVAAFGASWSDSAAVTNYIRMSPDAEYPFGGIYVGEPLSSAEEKIRNLGFELYEDGYQLTGNPWRKYRSETEEISIHWLDDGTLQDLAWSSI